MSRSRVRVGVGLLTGHTTLRAHTYKLKLAEKQDCQLYGDNKRDSVHIVCHCPVSFERYRTWESMFLRPQDLQVRVGSLLNLVANIRLGLVP